LVALGTRFGGWRPIENHDPNKNAHPFEGMGKSFRVEGGRAQGGETQGLAGAANSLIQKLLLIEVKALPRRSFVRNHAACITG
jgi:hypothetical protein